MWYKLVIAIGEGEVGKTVGAILVATVVDVSKSDIAESRFASGGGTLRLRKLDNLSSFPLNPRSRVLQIRTRTKDSSISALSFLRNAQL